MKIFLISNMYPSKKDPYYGVFVKNFISSMQPYGIKFSQTALIKGRTDKVLFKIFRYAIFYTEILYNGLISKYDLIYVHNITHTSIPIRILLTFRNSKVILNPHGEDILTTTIRSQILLKLATPLFKKTNLIISPSLFFKKIIETKYHINPTKVCVSSSGGISDAFFSKIDFNSKKDHFVIGFVSRIIEGKGWKILLNALHDLKEEVNLKCIIVGDGEDESSLYSEIDRLHLSSIVDYRGMKSQLDLQYINTEFDLFVFPTLFQESLGLVGLEAMAAGVPVVGSKIGGLTDYIRDGHNGYFFEPGNSKMLAEKIRTYYKMPEQEKREMRKNAQKTAKSYASDKVSKKLFHEIQKIC